MLFQHTEFLADLDECVNALVEMLFLVSRRKLHADTGLVLRHYRIVEAGNIDAFFLHLGREHL